MSEGPENPEKDVIPLDPNKEKQKKLEEHEQAATQVAKQYTEVSISFDNLNMQRAQLLDQKNQLAQQYTNISVVINQLKKELNPDGESQEG